MNGLINPLLHAAMAWRRFTVWPAFTRQLEQPDERQWDVLRLILQRNRTTRFGQAHQFAAIQSPADYAARVPLQTYEDLRPYIERQQNGSPAELTRESPRLFAQTSGTTGQPKYIPILDRSIADAQANQRLFSFALYRAIPGLFAGKSLGFVSPAIEGHLPSGTRFGSMSGLIYRSQPWLLRQKYVVPAPVFEIPDYEAKYFTLAAFALAETNITYMGAANPSTFIKLAAVIRAQGDALARALTSGVLDARKRIPPPLERALQPHFRAQPRRADELRALLAQADSPLFSQLWPRLRALSCWREGSCRLLLPAVQRLLLPTVPLLELGYLASEFRGSLPVDPLQHREVPTLHQNYFEFIERSDWESGRRVIKRLGQLEVGRAYYVVITTPAGLYRYFMNDIVQVDGFWRATPTLKFVEKGAGVTNLTGEKLYESQVTAAVSAVLSSPEGAATFFVMVAHESEQRYRFYIEAPVSVRHRLQEQLDLALDAQNLEFKAKRASGRLGATAVHLLKPGTGETFKTHLLAQGQREAQFKFLRLQSQARLTFNFDAHVLDLPS